MHAHAHPSRPYSCGRLPSASSKPFSFPHIALFFSLLILRRQPIAGNDPRMPAEFGDDGIARGHAHVVDARAAAAGNLPRLGHEPVAELARLDEGDLTLRRDHALIVRIAGERKGGIGEREDEAAMSDALAVDHVG